MIAVSRTVIVLAATVALLGCQSVAGHRDQVSGADDDRLTVGTVQRDIEIGMSGAEVAQVLGSPNVVTTDEQRREVWVYDKISTQSAFSNSSSSTTASLFGIPFISEALVAGSVQGGATSSAGAQETSQRTLTVVIKFDEAGLVRDYGYHTSRF